jgi:hypothetical protein
MALVLSKTEDSGIVVESAYAKIEQVSGNESQLQLTVYFYFNEEARFSGKPPFSQSQYSFKPEESEGSLRWDRQGYEYLKFLPEFSEAIDN